MNHIVVFCLFSKGKPQCAHFVGQLSLEFALLLQAFGKSLLPPSVSPPTPHRYATITTTVMGSLVGARTVTIARDYTSARNS